MRRLAVGALATAGSLLVVFAGPASAEDLDCGDPGVGVNFPVDPNNDPHGFDRDNDGKGCETAEGGTESATPHPPTTHPHHPRRTELARTGSTDAAAVEAVAGASLLAMGAAALAASRRYRPRHLAR